MNRYHALFRTGIALCFYLFVVGCSSNKAVVRFKPKAPELYSKKSLPTLIKASPSPKIVLRITTSKVSTGTDQQSKAGYGADTAGKVGSESEDVVRNVIERQLFRSGFSVRDRSLFNEVMRKAGDIDYETVNALTDTDLILELVKLDTRVPYVTNKYYQQGKKGEVERVMTDPKNSLTLYGGLVEFKLIYVRTNETVGTYLFNYVPCLQGCPYEIQSDGTLVRSGSATRTSPHEQDKPDYLDRFLTRATQQLVQAIKQTPTAVSRTK